MEESNTSTAKDSEANGEENKLECAVCLQNCIQPVQLPCSHVFCYLCVKGATQQSKRCAMCRQEIPADYLNNPRLIDSAPQPSVAYEGSYQWFYEGRNGWWQYDDRTSAEIEAAFKKGDTQCEVLIAGFLYIIDFQQNVQVRRADPHRRRRIKRDLLTIQKKGVAGIRQLSSGSSSGDAVSASVDARGAFMEPGIPPHIPIPNRNSDGDVSSTETEDEDEEEDFVDIGDDSSEEVEIDEFVDLYGSDMDQEDEDDSDDDEEADIDGDDVGIIDDENVIGDSETETDSDDEADVDGDRDDDDIDVDGDDINVDADDGVANDDEDTNDDIDVDRDDVNVDVDDRDTDDDDEDTNDDNDDEEDMDSDSYYSLADLTKKH